MDKWNTEFCSCCPIRWLKNFSPTTNIIQYVVCFFLTLAHFVCLKNHWNEWQEKKWIWKSWAKNKRRRKGQIKLHFHDTNSKWPVTGKFCFMLLFIAFKPNGVSKLLSILLIFMIFSSYHLLFHTYHKFIIILTLYLEWLSGTVFSEI